MRRVLSVVLLVLALACDPGGVPDELAAPDPGVVASSTPNLPAAEPPPPTLAAFSATAAQACGAAADSIQAAALRGDPLAQDARRRDVRAAVRHYRLASRAWTDVAETLFDFGLPAAPRGRRLLAAVDVVALRAQQLADALASADRATAQAAVAAYDTATAEADAAARRLDLRPLGDCGRAAEARGRGRRSVVIADDFTFQVGPLRAGRVQFVLRNVGQERHQLFVVPLRASGTLREAVAADRRGDPPGRFLAGGGDHGPVTLPGERSSLAVRLRPGAYGFMCFVASQDGTPHAYKGMAVEVAVGS